MRGKWSDFRNATCTDVCNILFVCLVFFKIRFLHCVLASNLKCMMLYKLKKCKMIQNYTEKINSNCFKKLHSKEKEVET